MRKVSVAVAPRPKGPLILTLPLARTSSESGAAGRSQRRPPVVPPGGHRTACMAASCGAYSRINLPGGPRRADVLLLLLLLLEGRAHAMAAQERRPFEL